MSTCQAVFAVGIRCAPFLGLTWPPWESLDGLLLYGYGYYTVHPPNTYDGSSGNDNCGATCFPKGSGCSCEFP